MWSSDKTSAVIAMAPSSSTGSTMRHDSPAKKITYKPADSTRMAVPRSGCFTIRPTGTATSINAIKKSGTRNWPSRR